MAVSYKKLFKILIDRDMKKKEFREFVGISYSTMSKLEKGENTNVYTMQYALKSAGLTALSSATRTS